MQEISRRAATLREYAKQLELTEMEQTALSVEEQERIEQKLQSQEVRTLLETALEQTESQQNMTEQDVNRVMPSILYSILGEQDRRIADQLETLWKTGAMVMYYKLRLSFLQASKDPILAKLFLVSFEANNKMGPLILIKNMDLPPLAYGLVTLVLGQNTN